jgi:hypothetical protein
MPGTGNATTPADPLVTRMAKMRKSELARLTPIPPLADDGQAKEYGHQPRARAVVRHPPRTGIRSRG